MCGRGGGGGGRSKALVCITARYNRLQVDCSEGPGISVVSCSLLSSFLSIRGQKKTKKLSHANTRASSAIVVANQQY